MVDLQTRRARHLKNLRKEIRKLELLEQKILLSKSQQGPQLAAQDDYTTSYNNTNNSSSIVSPPQRPVVPDSPARKLTFVKKAARGGVGGREGELFKQMSQQSSAAAVLPPRRPDRLWTMAATPTSPDKTDHGVESIRNTASSSQGVEQRRPRLEDKAVQADSPHLSDTADVTSTTLVEKASLGSSRGSRRGQQQRGIERSRSLQTETLQVVTRRVETRTEQSTTTTSTSSLSSVSLTGPAVQTGSESCHQAPPERRTDRRKKLPSSGPPSADSEPISRRQEAWVERRDERSPTAGEKELYLQLHHLQSDKENQAGRPKKVAAPQCCQGKVPINSEQRKTCYFLALNGARVDLSSNCFIVFCFKFKENISLLLRSVCISAISTLQPSRK